MFRHFYTSQKDYFQLHLFIFGGWEAMNTQESRRQGEQQQHQEEGSVRTDTLHGREAVVEVGFKAACRAA